MTPSTELHDLLLAYWAAFSSGQVAFVEAHLSGEPGILGIGTDPEEWYEGARLHVVWQEQLRAVGEVSISPGDVAAWEEGSVGWVAGRPTFTFPDGTAFTARFTAVARREGGTWKLVQAHTSAGVSNEDLLRRTLPT